MIQILKDQKAIEINGKEYKDNVPNYRLLSSKELLLEGPIARHYDWPSKYDKPMAHQAATADFVTQHRRGFVFNSIGTGKTLIIDWLIDFLIQEKEITRALIVAPLSTLQCVHRDELRYSLPHLDNVILHGSKAKRLELLNKDVQVYIINFEGLGVIEDELKKRNDINGIFIDELTAYGNKTTARWKVANNLFGTHTDKIVCGFTGSPMPNAPTDCYGQACLIQPNSLPQKTDWRSGKQKPVSYTHFKRLTMTQSAYSEFVWESKPNWEKICYEALQPSIRFEASECIDLPPLITEYRDVEMSNDQKKAYKQMKQDMLVTIDDEVITAANAGIKLMKLVQIASGSIYKTDTGKAFQLDCSARHKELHSLIDESKGHTLIYVPFKNVLPIIKLKLEKRYGAGCCELVYSDVSPADRAAIYTRFTVEDLRFIVATPQCMAHGLNLQAKCSMVVWWAPVLGYRFYEQACGRVYRNGQTETTLFMHLQGSPVEKELYQKLVTKESNQRLLLKLLKGDS
jgi:SNF2 family DNA or RNA helicase